MFLLCVKTASKRVINYYLSGKNTTSNALSSLGIIGEKWVPSTSSNITSA